MLFSFTIFVARILLNGKHIAMRYCLITLLLAAFLPALAQERNLEELYRQIDEAIDHSPEYVAAYETRINEVERVLCP